MPEIVIWGAGKSGCALIDMMHQMGIKPNYVCDSNVELWGSMIRNEVVCSPDYLYHNEKPSIIFVASIYYEEIECKLLDHGFHVSDIIRADNILSPRLIRAISRLDPLFDEAELFNGDCEKVDFVFDLSQGMVLGGVEHWTYAQAKILKNAGNTGKYIVNASRGIYLQDDTFACDYYYENDSLKESGIITCIKAIVTCNPKVIVCNFPREVFYAACLVKKYIYKNLIIIAVIHNDERRYYEAYGEWEGEISFCLAISDKTERGLEEAGINPSKIKRIKWKVSVNNLHRTYTKEFDFIRIGYAGRIVKFQKRLDMVIELAQKLKMNGIKFKLEIAGRGNFEEEAKDLVSKYGLTGEVAFMGLLEQSQINKFWTNKDLYINCSEWEGHSISQVEAMSCGVAFVTTNVSGSSDDVEHMYNGFIEDVGDIDSMVEDIKKLYYDRELLALMGQRSKKKFNKEYLDYDEYSIWKCILEFQNNNLNL